MSFIFGALLLGIMLFMGYQYYCLYQLTQERQVLMSYDHQHDIKNITVPVFKKCPEEKDPYGITFEGIQCDPKSTNNQVFAKFYGFDSIRAENC